METVSNKIRNRLSPCWNLVAILKEHDRVGKEMEIEDSCANCMYWDYDHSPICDKCTDKSNYERSK